jgi:hypothetical protein
MMQARKGVIWVSAVIYVLIAVVVMIIVLEAGLPLIAGLNEQSAFNKISDSLVSLDRQIQSVASEGQGSQRVLPLEVSDGEVLFTDNKLRWKLETANKIVEPRSRVELGNIVIASDVDVSAAERGSFYILENAHLIVNITANGTASNYSALDTTQLVQYIHYKDNNARTTGTFSFFVNDSTSAIGTGYTALEKSGTGLTSASVKTHVNNSAMEYDLYIILDSKADFIRASVRNFRQK